MKQAVIIEMSTEDLLGSLSEVRATLAKLNFAIFYRLRNLLNI